MGVLGQGQDKVEKLYEAVPKTISIVGGHVTKTYKINWEREGTTEFEGSRFVFTLAELENPIHEIAC